MKPLDDYRFVRGVNHHMSADPEIIARDMSFCKKLGINSTRVWMSKQRWKENPESYVRDLKFYVGQCWESGVSTMPIFWNGNGLADPSYSEEEWVDIEKYVSEITAALKDEPGLLIYDIINEPGCCDWVGEAPADEKQGRLDIIWAFVKRLAALVKKYDPVNATCVGHVIPEYNDVTHDWVDVLCFHDYETTRSTIEEKYQIADRQRKQYGKPMMQTETGCICRSDPYDIELEMCDKYNMGWYLFNLVIEGGWSDVHGLIYPDGTIRDPSIIAALFGFYRKRSQGRIFTNPNREGHAYLAIKAVEDVLMSRKASQHRPLVRTSDEILEAAEYCVNLLEAAEMVPMWDLPSARIEEWRAMPESQRDIRAIKAFAYEMSELLRKNCLIGTVPDKGTWAPDK